MRDLWDREPAMIVGFVSAALALAVEFGADLSDQQTGAIIAFVTAVAALVTRSQVTPTGKQ